MKLRHLIERHAPVRSGPGEAANSAKIATAARGVGRSLAELAELAAPPEPERWPNILRVLSVEGVDLRTAADALGRLIEAGTVAEALALGWDARDLVGLWRFPPHDLPSRAGLVFSLHPGDIVRSIRSTGCVISTAKANLRHIWLRAPVRGVLLPWEFPAASPLGPEICPPDSIRLPASSGGHPEAKSSPTPRYGLPEHGGSDVD